MHLGAQYFFSPIVAALLARFYTYRLGAKKIGFDLSEEVAEEYEDNVLSAQYLSKLKKSGFDETALYESVEQDGSISLYSEDYVKIWFHFVKVGNPSFIQEPIKTKSISIGGYGLF